MAARNWKSPTTDVVGVWTASLYLVVAAMASKFDAVSDTNGGRIVFIEKMEMFANARTNSTLLFRRPIDGGGQDALLWDAKFMASLMKLMSDFFFCGGALIIEPHDNLKVLDNKK
mmetsp:Transcript_42967/g.79642  ORF Transcript_42967/g.79642 Transcript_42967/m.79642 type:complete len:115 (-) Transcript_42967:167-511(-)